jgi:transketolase N-terminal domain/subunit
MHEGQIWETLQQAGHMKMDNLVAIIDYNGFSSHDPVNDVVNLEPLADKSAALAGMYWSCITVMICIRWPTP